MFFLNYIMIFLSKIKLSSKSTNIFYTTLKVIIIEYGEIVQYTSIREKKQITPCYTLIVNNVI